MTISRKDKNGEFQTFSKSKNPKEEYYDANGSAPEGTGNGEEPTLESLGKRNADPGTYMDTQRGNMADVMSNGDLSRQGPSTLDEMLDPSYEGEANDE